MSTIRETAEHFFVACETGKGWEGCKQYCHPDATFSAQAPALADIGTVEAYADWMAWLIGWNGSPATTSTARSSRSSTTSSRWPARTSRRTTTTSERSSASSTS
jgi:hypothetical protein